MTTYTVILAEVRNLLGDIVNTEFSDAVLLDFIQQCIRDLSMHFPRTSEYTLSTTLNERKYELETYITGILSVEFPTDEDPPIFLKRRAYTHPRFWMVDGYYDFIKPADADTLNPPRIWISNKPAEDEVITIRVTTEHNALIEETDDTTIQDRHLHLFGLFVRWKCWQQLATKEGMDPGALQIASTSLESNATAAEHAYRAALQSALEAEGESGLAEWKLDRFDRTY